SVTHSMHTPCLFCALPQERISMLVLMDKARHALDGELQPAAYDVGLNDGAGGRAGYSAPAFPSHSALRGRR
ncbi:MAG: hypothetical protein ABIH03_11570, partial [Pseudomonadota bacterium]